MKLHLGGRTVLVTGGSRGIGREIAREFAREGARVAVTFHTDRNAAEDLIQELSASGCDPLAIPMDLSSPDSIQAAMARVTSTLGSISVLVNNAFRWGEINLDDDRPFEEIPPERWRTLSRAGIEGVLEITQSVLPAMRKQGWGRIVNVSAIVGADGLAGYAWYSTVKSALHGFTKTIAREVGSAGVLVNCVLPGLTRTDRAGHISPEMQQLIASQTPIRRVIEPRDVASVVVFLCSAANTAVTGQLIRVSGGL